MTDWLTKRAEAEREWFKQEHERQFGKPPYTSEQDIALNKVVAKFEKLSKRRVCERKHFVPKIELPPPIVQIDWDAPLALHCMCPTGDCACTCKGNTLLPRKRLPIVPRYNWWGVRPVLCKLHIVKSPKQAGDLARNLAEAVKKESEFYKSKQGRDILTERGPEFCLSGCLKFYITNKKMEKDYTKIIGEMKSQFATDKTPVEVQEEQEVPKKEVTDRICDQFRCTVSTQSQVDEHGEFIIGDYSHLLFGMPDEEFLCDIEGAELNVASYKGPICAPRESVFLGVVRTADKLFHVTDIKQRISQVKKELITSIFEIQEKCQTKASQYECKDLPIDVPEAVCESLADVRRKRREKECLEKNTVPEKEKIETQDAEGEKIVTQDEACYCRFRYKQMLLAKSSDTAKGLKEAVEILQDTTPSEPHAQRVDSSKNNLKPLEDITCPSCVSSIRLETKENKSLSDGGKRVKYDLPQFEQNTKEKVKIGKQTSFIGSLEISYDENTNPKFNKMDTDETLMPEEGRKLGVRFSKEVATDLMPEFYGKFGNDFDIVGQENNSIQIEDIVEPFKDEYNQTSIELLDNVKKDASILIDLEINLFHKTISTVKSVELVILRPNAKCNKRNIASQPRDMRIPSCTPCIQGVEPSKQVTTNENNISPDKNHFHEAVKSLSEVNFKENSELSDSIREENFKKPGNSLENIQGKADIGTENISEMLKEIKKTYKDGTCQPCDKLLKIAKCINDALTEPVEDADFKELRITGDSKGKIKGSDKISAELTEDIASPQSLEEKEIDNKPQEQSVAAQSSKAPDSKGTIVRKELSKTRDLEVLGTEKKVGTAAEIKTEVSKTEEFKNIASTGSKISSEDKILDSVKLEKDTYKTNKLGEVSSVESKTNRDKFLITVQEKQRASKNIVLEDELIGTSQVGTHKESSKADLPDLRDIKLEISKTDDTKETPSIQSKTYLQDQELDSKARHAEAAEVKQEISEAYELNDISPKGSKINTQIHTPGHADNRLELADVKEEAFKKIELKDTSRITSEMDSQTRRMSNKSRISEAAEVKKKEPKTDELKDTLSIVSNTEELKEVFRRESKMNSLTQHLDSKDNFFEAAVNKEDISKTDELNDISSTKSELKAQTNKPSSKIDYPESTDMQKEVSKTKDLKNVSSVESKIVPQARKLGSKGSLSEVKQDLSEADKLRDTSSSGSKIGIQTYKPSSKDNLSIITGVKNEVSKAVELKEVSSIGSKIDSQAQKPSTVKKLSGLTKVIKEAPKTDEFKEGAGPLCKINSKTRKPSCMGRFSELSDIKKISKTDELKHDSSIMCRSDSETWKPNIKGWFSKLRNRKKDNTKTDELKDLPSIMCHSDSVTRGTSSKGKFSELDKEKKIHKSDDLKISHKESKVDSQSNQPSSKDRFLLSRTIEEKPKPDEVNENSSEKSKVDTQKLKLVGSKTKLSDLAGVNKISKIDKITSIASTESDIKTESQKSMEVEKDVSKSEQLKEVFSIESKEDSVTQKPGYKDKLRGLISREKETSKKKQLKEDLRLESKEELENQRSAYKDKLKRLMGTGKKVSKIEQLIEDSSIESKEHLKAQKLGYKNMLKRLIGTEIKMSKKEQLKEVSRIESNADFEIQKPTTNNRLKELKVTGKEVSMKDQSRKDSRIEPNQDFETRKPSYKEKLKMLIGTEKEVSKKEQSKGVSVIESKKNFDTGKPGSKGKLKELIGTEKEVSKTKALNVKSLEDSLTQKNRSEKRLINLKEVKKEVPTTDKLIERTESNVTQSQGPSPKSDFKKSTEATKEVSDIDKLMASSIIDSKRDSQTQNPTIKNNLTDLTNIKKEVSKIDNLKHTSKNEFADTQPEKLSSTEGLPELTRGNREVSKMDELKKLISIKSDIDVHIENPSSKHILPELRKVKDEASKSHQLKMSPSLESDNDTQTKKQSSKDDGLKLSYLKKEVSKTNELKEVSDTDSNSDNRPKKPSGKDILIPKLSRVRTEQTNIDELKDNSNIELKNDTQNTRTEDAQKKEASDLIEGTTMKRDVIGPIQSQGGHIKTAPKETKQGIGLVSGPCPVKKLTNLKNTIKRFLVPEDIPKVCKDAACQPCYKLKGLEEKVHKAFSDLEHTDLKDIKENTGKKSNAKNAPKGTKQDIATVSGPCPVKKLTTLKNTIKRFLIPQDIPKVCKDAACQPCFKLKGFEKDVHKAFSDMEHSELKIIKENTEKGSNVKKKADIVISQFSIDGNNERINVLNQSMPTEFVEAPLYVAPNLKKRVKSWNYT